MELNIYNKQCSNRSVTGPWLRFTKQGVIYFNQAALDMLNLTAGNTVSFANDKSRPKDWYLFRDADGLPLKPKSGKDKSTGTQSLGIATAVICTKIRETCSIVSGKNFSVNIATEATEINGKALWALITSKTN